MSVIRMFVMTILILIPSAGHAPMHLQESISNEISQAEAVFDVIFCKLLHQQPGAKGGGSGRLRRPAFSVRFQYMQQSIREDASLALAREGNDQELATSFATIAGRTSEEPLEGTVLEACIQHGNRYLLFLTDDIPFEDSLHIHLLDEDLNRIDTATLGAPYTTGHFRNLTFEDPGGITFEFFGDCVWEISVSPRKRLRLPFASDPRGVSWQNGWFHVLELRARK